MSKKAPTPETTAAPAVTTNPPPEATAPATAASNAAAETTAPPPETNTPQAGTTTPTPETNTPPAEPIAPQDAGGNAALVVGATPSPVAASGVIGIDLAAPGADSTVVFDVELPPGDAPPAGVSLSIAHPVKHDGTLYLGDVTVSAALAEIFRALGVVAD